MSKKVVFTSMLITSIFLFNQPAWAESRLEYWTSLGFTESVNDKVTLTVAPELRYKGGMSNHYYTHFDIGFDWKVNNWLVIGPYYRHVEEKKNSDWKVEYQPNMNATVKFNLFGIDFSDRNRIEYRIKEDDDFYRYRNKLTAKFKKMTQFDIQPYIAEEPFYDFDADEFNKNRLYSGFSCTIFEKLKTDVYYILESRRSNNHWTEVNVFGINFRYPF